MDLSSSHQPKILTKSSGNWPHQLVHHSGKGDWLFTFERVIRFPISCCHCTLLSLAMALLIVFTARTCGAAAHSESQYSK